MAAWVPPEDKWWFKSVGAAESPMEASWFDIEPNETEIIHFAKRPTAVRVSHPLLYYAASHQKIFGIVTVFTKPLLDPDRKKWPWFSEVRPKVIIKSLERAPSLDILDEIDPGKDWHKFVQQMDYNALPEEVFNHAAAALVAAADPEMGDLLDARFAEQFTKR